MSYCTKVLILAVVLFAGLLALTKTATIFAQSGEDTLLVENQTNSDETIQKDVTDDEAESSTLQDDSQNVSTLDSASATVPEGVVSDIDSGDATSNLTTTVTQNTNDTIVQVPNGTDTTVTNNNTAETNTLGEVTAETGNNTATDTSSVTIKSGDAVSTANVVNVINTNIFNSTGLFYFMNILLGNTSLDFRSMFSVLTGDTPTEESCAPNELCFPSDTHVTTHNTNEALVNNDITVTAGTGNNSINTNTGNTSIQTGHAFASANVINLINTNITDSNYLLLTVNNFEAGLGDIIFPGAEWFYDLLAQNQGLPTGSQTAVTNTNEASVDTTATVEADTGNNTATGTSSTIDTGNATAGATIVNKVNQNIFGNSISFLFRIHGDWAGDIFGLPEGMSWRETGDGVEIYFDEASEVTAPVGSTDNLTVTNTNSAVVKNNVSVFALTGDNKVSAPEGSATIHTGDAHASANIVNIVNTNVLGRNWVLAIFNIFGDWNGNVSFGQPDLWIGARARNTSPLRGGSCFSYEITINNLGDANANNVMIHGVYDKLLQTFETFTTDAKGLMSYYVGRIDAGKTSVVTLPVCLAGNIRGQKNVTTEFEVVSLEKDADVANNKEIIGVTTAFGGGGKLLVSPPNLSITKTADRDIVTASSSVTYQITITNTGGPVYNALLLDTIYTEEGVPIHEQRWGLETIKSNETIVVSYEAFFEASTSPGKYTNKAFISGADTPQDSTSDPVHSPIATATIQIIPVAKELLPKVCTSLLSTYITYLEENDPEEVTKLQFFLRTFEGFTTVDLTGIYDKATYSAVHEFQRRHAREILEPWGMKKSSGYVYITTQKKINELWCGTLDFSLTETQKKEIEEFRHRTQNYIIRKIEVPEETYNRFGMAPTDTNGATRIAVGTTTRTQHSENASVAVSQNNLATVNQAFTSNITRSFWASIRDKILPSLTWLHF